MGLEISTEDNETLSAVESEEKAIKEQLAKMMSSEYESEKTTKKKKHFKKWSRKRKIITFIIILAAAFVLFRFMTNSNKTGTIVSTTGITMEDISRELSLQGPVSGTDSVEVVSNLHAEITEIKIKEGDKVKKGQLLAVISDQDVQKQVDIAQNTYDIAVSTYNEKDKEAKAGYAKAQQDYNTAQTDYNRKSVLFNAGDISALDMEAAANERDNAKRQLDLYTLKDNVPVPDESYSLQIENARFDLEKRKEELENTKVTSPINGTVVRVYAKVGRFADKLDDDKPMFSIENLDNLEMKIKVSEYSIGNIKLGQQVVISADILNGETVGGEVTAISPTGEEKGGGSTERVIPITIRITDKDTKLIAGITAKAKIVIEESKGVLTVPFSSIIQKDDGMYIAAVEDGYIKMIGVETGVENDFRVEVRAKEGYEISEGMQIAATPQAELTDGMKVIAIPSGE